MTSIEAGEWPGEGRRRGRQAGDTRPVSKPRTRISSSSTGKPLCQRPRRLADWLNPDGQKKVHSLVDKVYQPKNLRVAWDKVKANRGSGGIDGQSLAEFEQGLEEHLRRLHEELRTDRYQPLPVKRVNIPKPGKPGEWRPLGIPAVYDRVCQQALLNRLEPNYEPIFDDSSFGYRPGRAAKDALRKVWGEIEAGAEWIVDADLRDYFGTLDHEKLMTLVARRVADGRVLTLIEQMLQAGYIDQGRLFPTSQGPPQGGVVSPLLSNILLTPFDREMRRRGSQLTRYADDWLVTGRSRREAEAALGVAEKILGTLGVRVNRQKTQIVHVRQGFAFLGYKHQARQSSASAAAREDPVRGASRGSVRVPDAEVRQPVQEQHSPEDAASHSAEHCGADPRDQSCDPRVGRVLQTRSRAETLPPTRRVGGATAVVASSPAMALQGVEDTSEAATPRRVGAGRLDFADSFFTPAAGGRAFVKAACGKTARAV